MNKDAKNAHEHKFTRQGKIYDAIANEMLGLGEDTGGSIIQSPRGTGFSDTMVSDGAAAACDFSPNR